MVALTASVITLFFGMSKKDISVVFISALLGYVSYNMYRVSENYYKIAENPNDFDTMWGWSEVFVGKKNPDTSKLKACLEENTFYFGIFVDFVVKHVISMKK